MRRLVCLSILIASIEAATRCLMADEFKTRMKTEELVGEWQLAHARPLERGGFSCPADKLKVTHVTFQDINYWKTKCLHKLDISILDETKFELKVTFPEDFEEDFTIIHRDQRHGDQILFPTCVFVKTEFVRKGDKKMWIATTEQDGLKHVVAVSLPDPEESTCVLLNSRYYHFC